MHFIIFNLSFNLLILETGKGEREREKQQFVVSPIHTSIGWFLYVPWWGTEPLTQPSYGTGCGNKYWLMARTCRALSASWSNKWHNHQAKRTLKKDQISSFTGARHTGQGAGRTHSPEGSGWEWAAFTPAFFKELKGRQSLGPLLMLSRLLFSHGA